MVHSVLDFTGADNGDSCSSDAVVVPEPYASFGHVFDCVDDVDDSFLEGVYYVDCAQSAWADTQPLPLAGAVPELIPASSIATSMSKCQQKLAAKHQAPPPAWLSGVENIFDAAITGDDCAWQSTVLDQLCDDTTTPASILDADCDDFLERILSREASPFLSEASGASDSSVFDGEDARTTLVGDKRGFLSTVDFVDPFATISAAVSAVFPTLNNGTTTNNNSNKRRKCSASASSSRSSTPLAAVPGSRSSSPAVGAEGEEGEVGTKRDTHNFLERCRRKDIKSNYTVLQSQVPAIAEVERIPTGQILLHAVDYIKQLQEEDRQFEAQIATLKQANAALRSKIIGAVPASI